MELIYQEHFDLDGEPLAVPVIPSTAMADEIGGDRGRRGRGGHDRRAGRRAERPSCRGRHLRWCRTVTRVLKARTKAG